MLLGAGLMIPDIPDANNMTFFISLNVEQVLSMQCDEGRLVPSWLMLKFLQPSYNKATHMVRPGTHQRPHIFTISTLSALSCTLVW